VPKKRLTCKELLAQCRRGERGTIHVEEAAIIVGCGRNQMYTAVQRDEIPHLGIGRRILIPVAPFLAWLDGAR
jgi:excisionase family DNA binding protein